MTAGDTGGFDRSSGEATTPLFRPPGEATLRSDPTLEVPVFAAEPKRRRKRLMWLPALVIVALAAGGTAAYLATRSSAKTTASGPVPDPQLVVTGTDTAIVVPIDFEGEASLVSLYANGHLIDRADGFGPTALVWKEPPPGRHSITLLVIGPDGTARSSQPVLIDVNRPVGWREGEDNLGGAIMILKSLPTDTFTRERAESAASLLVANADDRIKIRILLSNDFPSLSPGFWVIYAGPFDNAVDAARACWTLGMTEAEQCYGRPLTDDPADADTVENPRP